MLFFYPFLRSIFTFLYFKWVLVSTLCLRPQVMQGLSPHPLPGDQNPTYFVQSLGCFPTAPMFVTSIKQFVVRAITLDIWTDALMCIS